MEEAKVELELLVESFAFGPRPRGLDGHVTPETGQWQRFASDETKSLVVDRRGQHARKEVGTQLVCLRDLRRVDPDAESPGPRDSEGSKQFAGRWSVGAGVEPQECN